MKKQSKKQKVFIVVKFEPENVRVVKVYDSQLPAMVHASGQQTKTGIDHAVLKKSVEGKRQKK